MTDFYEEISKLSPQRLTLLALQLKEQLEASEFRTREPIAVVGLGCRFPGAESPEAFTRLLEQGEDAIREVPADRWDIERYFNPDPDVPGTMNTRYGGFLDSIDRFDPAHFGISPREAAGMDPQQRLFLEVAWEALEHAGIAPDRLAGTPTGVFLGIATLDYASLVMQLGEQSLDLYSSSGGSHAVAAGRLAYVMGLQGPALSVDTACSSSLVATHLACQSLRNRECHTALVGGVNVICAPQTTLMLSRARMMAPDGRCKTFDERADGFVRGEGCGVLVLRRLEDAQAGGNRILAVLRGSAVNQDGRSSGLTAPNGPSQEAVIRAALADAGVTAGEVSYVEAHGTGTPLGDPIELQALSATYGAGRSPEQALVTSSVKTNFGHLEAAAGVAGLIKTILALQSQRIPPHLHADTPTSHVDWRTLGVRLPAAGGEPWLQHDAPRRAAVSSFGFSGTNAHVILEEAPPPAPATPDTASDAPTRHESRRTCLLPISGRTTPAVRTLAGRYAEVLARLPASRWPDMCDEAALGRAQLSGSRAAILAESAGDAIAALEQWSRGDGAAISMPVQNALVLASETVNDTDAEVALMFTGQGGATVGMGRALYDDAPAFREAMTRLDAPFRKHTGVSLIAVLYGDEREAFSRPDVSSAALVAFQIALAELWRSWGIRAVAVAGHSLGEYAAAVTAGALSADDALRMVAARGRAIAQLPDDEGTMLVVDASPDDTARILGEPVGAPAAIEIAAINAPEQFVLSGPVACIARAEQALRAHDIRVRPLGGLSHAYHSAQLDPMLASFESVCASATQRTPAIEWVSCLSGTLHATAEPVSARYWIDQMRQPVQWQRVVQTLAARGARVLLEVGPTAVLSGLSRASLEASGVANVLTLPSMRVDVDPWHTMLDAVGRGWVAGMAIEWTHIAQGAGARMPLPTYPFQRERYWLPASVESETRPSPPRRSSLQRLVEDRSSHDDGLLGDRLDGPVPTFAVPIGLDAPGVLRDHVVHGRPLLAGSAFIDLALSAADRVRMNHAAPDASRSVMLRDLQFIAPLALATDPADEARDAVLIVAERDEYEHTVTLMSRGTNVPDGNVWMRHARAVLTDAPQPVFAVRGSEPTVLMAALPQVVAHEDLYSAFQHRGIQLGASIRTVHTAWRRDGEALARLELPTDLGPAAQRAALLDGALQTLGLASPAFGARTAVGDRMLARIGAAQLSGSLERATWCHATITDTAADTWRGALTLLDVDGTVVGRLDDVALVRTVPNAEALRATHHYALEWEPRSLPIESERLPCDMLARTAFEQLAVRGATPGLEVYETLVPELERSATEYARTAFASLGLPLDGRILSDADLSIVAPQHRRLVKHLSRWVDSDDSTPVGLVPSHESGEMELLDRCGSVLADVLRGHADPLETLFPQGAFDVLDRIYRQSPFAHTHNGALREALRAEGEARGNAPLRVLEIGAGTGATTSAALDALPQGSEYVFTDLSPLFLERARAQFPSPRLDVRLLDIEQDPAAQGFANASFDVVIASNVLHATADLRRALCHVRHLMAPGALLLMLEGTASQRWVDLTFGLTEGWWRFTDLDLRPTHPLLDATRWVALLRDSGFADAASASVETSASGAVSTQALLLARTPAARALPLLILADHGGVGDALGALASAHGMAVELLARGDGDCHTVEERIDAFRAQHQDGVGIVYLWGLDIGPGTATNSQIAAVTSLTDDIPVVLMRAIARPDGGAAQLWMATRGAQAVEASSDVVAPEQAPLWGWWRGFALEHPAACGGCIDTDPSHDAAQVARRVLLEICGSTAEDQVAIRGGQRRVARLVRQPEPPPASPTVRPDAAYLITGGTGGLGLEVAQWLVQHGAGEIVLASRSGLPPHQNDPRHTAVAALRQAGCTVHVVAVDVADADALATLLARFGREWRPLRGIIHTAVEMSSGPVDALTRDARTSMRRGKVDAARLLDRLTRDHLLDFFVLYSSTTALLGVQGLAHYAAANQYLEALAHHRRTLGHEALAIAWGTWDVMRIASESDRDTFSRGGLRPLPSAFALDAQARLIAAGATSAVVADVDWNTLVPLYEARRSRPLIHALATADVVPAAPETAAPDNTALTALRDAAPGDRDERVRHLVRGEVAAVLGYASGEGIPDNRGFFELGLDSLMSLELKRRLEAAVARPLPGTLTFNYPNVASLSDFLRDALFAHEHGVSPNGTSTANGVTAPSSSPLAPMSSSAGPASSSRRSRDELTVEELEAELLATLERLQ